MELNRVGLNTEILDGNLITQPTIPENTCLVIERAYSGPSNVLYPVTDMKVAEAIFGANSPLVRLANDVLAGNNNTAAVAFYRIGGGSAKVNNVFGPYTSIFTTEETLASGQDVSIYVGPRPNDASKYCVLAWKAGKLVYSNVPGSIVDSKVIVVDSFDPETQPYRIGSISAPVALDAVADNLLDSIAQVEVATAGQTDITLGTPVASATANITVSKTVNGATSIVTDFTVTTSGANATGITLGTPASLGEVYSINYTKPASPVDVAAAGIEYVPGKNSLDANLKQLYELYDTAFEQLENVRATTVTVKDLFNCRNIAAGDDSSADRLLYLSRTETEEGFDYEWSADKFIYQLATNSSQTTTDSSLAATNDNGEPIVVKQYHEVDFAHRLGMWCYSNSTTSDFIHGTIGCVPLKSSSAIAVRRWIGTLPVVDIYGNLVEDGSGLLGNRFMVGTTTRRAGFYATDTGYPDGTIMLDSRGATVDIGKHLSITTIPVYLTTDVLSGAVKTPRSFSGMYAGLIASTTPGDSTTNKVLDKVLPAFSTKESVAAQLSSVGYVTLLEKTKGVTVYSGDLATSEYSDFDYISTAISVSYVIRRLQDTIDPYLGRGLDTAIAAAFQNSIDLTLKNAASLGVINGYAFKIRRVSANTLAIELQIKPKDELRIVEVTLSLTPDTTLTF